MWKVKAGPNHGKMVKIGWKPGKIRAQDLPFRFWMCLPPVVGPHSPGVDGILCSEWWLGPPSIYQYIVYYIPRSRHGAASHISQTSGFLHLLTSGQQPDTSSTPSAFTGVHKCWWRRLISKYQHSVAWDQAPAAAAKCVQKIAQI